MGDVSEKVEPSRSEMHEVRGLDAQRGDGTFCIACLRSKTVDLKCPPHQQRSLEGVMGTLIILTVTTVPQ